MTFKHLLCLAPPPPARSIYANILSLFTFFSGFANFLLLAYGNQRQRRDGAWSQEEGVVFIKTQYFEVIGKHSLRSTDQRNYLWVKSGIKKTLPLYHVYGCCHNLNIYFHIIYVPFNYFNILASLQFNSKFPFSFCKI